MATVTLSSKFQLVIPKTIRERSGLKAGTKFRIVAYGGRLELIPVGPLSDLYGFLEGIDTSIERDGDR
ncbi:MAG TPA: AbrB/MazE/SpoVT family DNA-binding domain-containing protein [Spirochaetales bacterium]|nr:AbrB/MazE/SpoVT family DNA-binding domain-containing protein [Spirochaetales bacterium]